MQISSRNLGIQQTSLRFKNKQASAEAGLSNANVGHAPVAQNPQLAPNQGAPRKRSALQAGIFQMLWPNKKQKL